MLRGLWIAVAASLLLYSSSPSAEDAWVTARLAPELLDVVAGRTLPQEPVVLRVATVRGRSAAGLTEVVRSRGKLQVRDDGSGWGTMWVEVEPDQVASAALALASHPDVAWVERYYLPVIKNDNSTWLLQSGNQSEGRTVFRHGLTGMGQVAGVADSGLDADACQFRYSF